MAGPGTALKTSNSYANNGTCLFQPGSGVEGLLEHAYAAGAAELHHYDGTNDSTVDTSTSAQMWSFFPALRCTNTDYFYLKNVSGTTALMWVSGIQTV
jgi:hypothetical protein